MKEDDMAEKSKIQGFAVMDPAKQREIAAKGGHAAHEKGTAHKFDPEEAARAGKKGGATVSKDRKHMAEIGRLGGKARAKKKEKVVMKDEILNTTAKAFVEGMSDDEE
jgi:general stress protein YciG